MTRPWTPKPERLEAQHQPTPRLRYEGDVHPITGERVFRTDEDGLRAAYRTILRYNPRHPALSDKELWKTNGN